MKRTQSPLPAAHDLTGHAGGDILAIGRCIHMLDEQHNAADELCVRLKQGPQYDAAGEEMNRLFDVMRDMENGALQRRAATIGDIAVQAAICHGVADTFDACILTDQQRHERAALIRRAMASIVLCASRIAGIPADSIARMQAVDLRREFPGAEV